jgi:ABC-type Fe3+ transport system permease subunit
LNSERYKQSRTSPTRQVEARDWWLWGFAVTVPLALTVGIVSLTFFGPHLLENSEWVDLKEWVRGLAGVVLLFDVYTVYQQLQLQRVRRN